MEKKNEETTTTTTTTATKDGSVVTKAIKTTVITEPESVADSTETETMTTTTLASEPIVSKTLASVDEKKESELVISLEGSEATIEKSDNVPVSNSVQEDDQSTVLQTKELILVFLGLILAMFLASVDQTIVSTCLPKIVSEFNSLDKISWAGTSYLLTATAVQPLYGKFSDIFGRRVAFLFCVIVFLTGSALCGASQNMIMLIASRGIAGIGTGGIISMIMIIISDIVPLHNRGKYQGFIGAVWGVASIIGPLIGGLLTDHASWRWAFYVNLPIGAVTVILVTFFLKLKEVHGSFREKINRIDYLGSMLTMTTIVCFLLPTNWGGNDYPWNDWRIIILYAFGGLLLITLVFYEWKIAAEPVIPPNVFKQQTTIAVYVTNFLMGTVLFSLIFYTPLYFQVVKHDSATTAGLDLLPLVIGLMICSVASGAGVSIIGHIRPFIWIGCAALTVGCGLLFLLNADSSRISQIGFLFVCGCGLGLFIQSAMLSAQSAVHYKDIAVVTSLANFFRIIGGIFGLALFASVLNNLLIKKLEDIYSNHENQFVITAAKNNVEYIWSIKDEALRNQLIDSYVQALKAAHIVLIPFAACAFLSSLFIQHHKLRKNLDEPTE